MRWLDLKARLLEYGTVNLSGEPADPYIARSSAGPGAGTEGAIFFSMGTTDLNSIFLDSTTSPAARISEMFPFLPFTFIFPVRIAL